MTLFVSIFTTYGFLFFWKIFVWCHLTRGRPTCPWQGAGGWPRWSLRSERRPFKNPHTIYACLNEFLFEFTLYGLFLCCALVYMHEWNLTNTHVCFSPLLKHIHTQTNARRHIQTHAQNLHTCTHTNTPTHTHTHTHMQTHTRTFIIITNFIHNIMSIIIQLLHRFTTIRQHGFITKASHRWTRWIFIHRASGLRHFLWHILC